MQTKGKCLSQEALGAAHRLPRPSQTLFAMRQSSWGPLQKLHQFPAMPSPLSAAAEVTVTTAAFALQTSSPPPSTHSSPSPSSHVHRSPCFCAQSLYSQSPPPATSDGRGGLAFSLESPLCPRERRPQGIHRQPSQQHVGLYSGSMVRLPLRGPRSRCEQQDWR